MLFNHTNELLWFGNRRNLCMKAPNPLNSHLSADKHSSYTKVQSTDDFVV